MKIAHVFAKMAEAIAHAAGRPATFILSVSIILTWAVSGPIFGFSDTWQLIINTFTTLVTFLMVFLIQNTQNRDAAAVHAKLDELVRVGKARNALIGLEHLDDDEVERVRRQIERQRDGKGGDRDGDALARLEHLDKEGLARVRKLIRRAKHGTRRRRVRRRARRRRVHS